MAVVGPVYSPLCDTDKVAYLGYLQVYREFALRVGDGGFVEHLGGEPGACHVREVGGRGIDFGDRVAGAEFGCSVGRSGCVSDVDAGAVGSAGRRFDSVDSGSGDTSKSGEERAAGLSPGDIASAVGGVVGASRCDDRTHASVGVGQPVPMSRRQKKNARKQRKKLAASVGSDSEFSAAGVEHVVGSRGGFFSSCHGLVQDELRESRAKRLIAENKLATARTESKLQELKSPYKVLSDVAKYLSIADKVSQGTSESKVRSWASVVAGSCAEDVAKSAPATVASLSSVGTSFSTLGSKWSFKRLEATAAEMVVVRGGAVDVSVLYAARAKLRRALGVDDMLGSKSVIVVPQSCYGELLSIKQDESYCL